MKKTLIPALFCVLFSTLSTAQDPIFSQYYAMPLQMNPAFAGSAFAPRFGLAYRHQWPGFSNAYQTYGVFYEQRIPRINSGIGFHLEGDNAGDGILRGTRFSTNYAYRLMFTKSVGVRIGIEAGFIQNSLNWDKLIFPDELDAIDGQIYTTMEQRPDQLTYTRLDLSSGLMVFGENFWAGFALKHLNTPNETFLLINNNVSRGLPLRYTLHGGVDITLRESNKKSAGAFVSPNLLFVSQGPYQQVNVGAYTGVGSFFMGLWYRHTVDQNQDAAIILAGFREGAFKIGLSYDASVSRLATVSGGSYELTMSVYLDQDKYLKKKNKQPNTAECPRFYR
jgi:type IX secretion system PorP/SprF family membrane protein